MYNTYIYIYIYIYIYSFTIETFSGFNCVKIALRKPLSLKQGKGKK